LSSANSPPARGPIDRYIHGPDARAGRLRFAFGSHALAIVVIGAIVVALAIYVFAITGHGRYCGWLQCWVETIGIGVGRRGQQHSPPVVVVGVFTQKAFVSNVADAFRMPSWTTLCYDIVVTQC
jgi:hypothetical protein